MLFRSLGATVSEPWFLSGNQNKIFVMYDVPHLMKNLRNNLLKYDITVNGDTVSFKFIQQMYHLEKQSSLRLCPKLTDDHFYLKPFKKMRVKLATQVLSHSVSTAIRTYVHFDKLDKSALPTADFVEHIDKLFDIMNSRFNANHKWRKSLTEKSQDQLAVLNEAPNWLASWTFGGDKEMKLPFHEGLILTVRSIHLAALYLLTQKHFKYVLTSRFNQDIVENWFSCIRLKGLNNDSRTVLEYESAGRALSVSWMLNVQGDIKLHKAIQKQ